MSRPRLTVRARLTLLYTGLFAACGAIVVVVSYVQVARLGTSGQGQQPASAGGNVGGFLAQCRSEVLSVHPNAHILAKCTAYFENLGAQGQRDFTVSHLLEYSLITVAVVLALAAVLGWIFSGRALRPVHLITKAARAASEHNLSARVAPTGPRDELRELAETFDAMLSRLQAAFEGQQRFIANASHELRTPLAVMRATVDVVLDDPDSTQADLRGMAADIRAAVDHAEHLIGALLLLARNERGLTVREETDLATVAEDVLDTAGLGDRRVHAALEPAVISGDPVLAEHLVANLVDNAVRYNHPGGDIWISTGTAAGSSQLTVANTGPVISAADAGRIFQPFERLNRRTSHDGFGLGLAIVASIAVIHGGTAIARPRDEGGLSVTVTIPSASAPPVGVGDRAGIVSLRLRRDRGCLMKVGIIGAGRIGGGLARQLAGAGHQVMVSFSRDAAALDRVAGQAGPGATAGSPAGAVAFGEVVVISVPWSALPLALEQAGSLAGKIVIDTTNQFGAPPLPAEGQTAAAFNAARMPGARYTKSFNTLTSAFQAEAAGRAGADRVVQWLCGDEAGAKEVVAGLITDAGFVPVDFGGTAGCAVMEAPRRPGAVYGEEYRLPDAMAVVEAVRAGRPIPPTPQYDG